MLSVKECLTGLNTRTADDSDRHRIGGRASVAVLCLIGRDSAGVDQSTIIGAGDPLLDVKIDHTIYVGELDKDADGLDVGNGRTWIVVGVADHVTGASDWAKCWGVIATRGRAHIKGPPTSGWRAAKIPVSDGKGVRSVLAGVEGES